MVDLLRIILRLLCFWRAKEQQREIERDLQVKYAAHRGKVNQSQDYRLKRDLEALNRENNES
jgi:hypothetical protein